jgi:hypothetical protein
LISGGDALVQVNLPPGLPPNGVKMFLNGTLINSVALRPNGRIRAS